MVFYLVLVRYIWDLCFALRNTVAWNTSREKIKSPGKTEETYTYL